MTTRPTTVVTDEVERVARAVGTAMWGKAQADTFMELSENAHFRLMHDAARAAIASMPTVVTGEQPLQSVGVPASPSGHSRAEPKEVSALRASVPNAGEIQPLKRLVAEMGRALDVADGIISINMGTDTPKEWHAAFRRVAEMMSRLK